MGFPTGPGLHWTGFFLGPTLGWVLISGLLAFLIGLITGLALRSGLIIGLDGTGDGKGAPFTMQSLANMMERMGLTVNSSQLKVKMTFFLFLNFFLLSLMFGVSFLH